MTSSTRIRGLLWVCVLAALLLGIPSGVGAKLQLKAGSNSPSSDTLSRVERWQEDVDSLTARLTRLHVDAFAYRDSSGWIRAAQRLKRRIPRLSDLETTLEMMKLVADLGDSHTQLVPWLSIPTHTFPFTLIGFEDGFYVTRVLPGYERLLGKRLVRLGSNTTEQAFGRITTLYASDNRYHRWHFVLPYLSLSEPLYGFELIKDSATATFTFADSARQTFKVELDATRDSGRPLFSVDSVWTKALSPSKRPLGWRRTDEHYWYEVIDRGRTLYVQYNTCREDASKPFDSFVDRISDSVEGQSLSRVVIDLRHNSGGDSSVIRPLYRFLEARPEPLYVIIGRGTFSSGLLNALTLRDKYGATLVGEPTSGRPHFFGETRIFRLPHSDYPELYSTKSFGKGTGGAPTLRPEVSIPIRAEDYFDGRDPVLQAITGGEI